MKQLKFMLAAATAIGLATAAQADTQLVKTEISSENFDAVTTLENTAALMALDGFTYEGATATDNESYVAAGGANSTANALKVNTGTDPLLRKIDTDTNNAITLDPTGAKKVYIDTMVQFTVTPYGDTVSSNGVNDKLMIYLKEMTNVVDGVVTITGTNLMVKAAKYTPANPLPPPRPASFDVVDAKISNVTVEPNKWYRLVVTTCLNSAGFVQFTIQIGEEGQEALVTLKNTDGLLATDDTVFPSLLGTTSATLDQVGFAGEGMVDELVFSHDVEQQTSVDFTFTWTTDGISAVTYTIGNKSGTVTSGTAIADLDPGATITIAVTPADWYELVDNPVLSYQVPDTTGQTQPLDALVKKVTQKTDAQGNVTINPAATTAEIQAAASITTGYFGGENTTASVEEFQAVLNWKSKKGGSKANINNISFVAAGKVGAGDPETDDAKAYLLDCDVDDVETEIKKFTFKGFSLVESGKPVFGVGKAGVEAPTVGNGGEYGNGHVEIRGKASLEANDWVKDCPGASFFRAFLVK